MHKISRYCNSYSEIIQSEEFYKVISLILDKVTDFDKDKILTLFQTDNISLSNQKILLNFLEDNKIQELAKRFINKKIDVNEDDASQFTPEQEKFIELMNTLFWNEQWYENISNEVKNKCEEVLQIENNEKPEVDLNKNTLESILPYYIKQTILHHNSFQWFPYLLLEKLESEIWEIKNFFFWPSYCVTIVWTQGMCVYDGTWKLPQCEITSDLWIGNITHWKDSNLWKYSDISKYTKIYHWFQREGNLYLNIYWEKWIAEICGMWYVKISKLPNEEKINVSEESIKPGINNPDDSNNKPDITIDELKTQEWFFEKMKNLFK